MMPFRFQKHRRSLTIVVLLMFVSTDEPYLQFRRNVFYPKSKEQQVLVTHMLHSSQYVILDE